MEHVLYRNSSILTVIKLNNLMTKINSNTTDSFIFYTLVYTRTALSLCNFIINRLSKFLCTEENLSKYIRYNIHFE